MAGGGLSSSRLYIVLGLIGLFGIVTLILAAATLGTVNKRLNVIESILSPTTTSSTTTTTTSQNSSLITSMNIEEVLQHLKELQTIGNSQNNTRAINTRGFNDTLDYITNTLANRTNFKVSKTFFSVRDFALASNPILTSSINGVINNYTYSSEPSTAQFLHVKYSTASNITTHFQLTVIPNGGCTEADWRNASASPTGRVALVKRGGSCTFSARAAQAPKFNVTGVLFYNDGTLPDRFSPIEVSLSQENALPALFLSFNAGEALANAALNTSINVTVQLGIDLKDLPNFPVGNICADTPTGDVTQTIVIGSHSDSVPAGPGINDNGKLFKRNILLIYSFDISGSGSAANLGLAIALARLFQTSTYAKYKYRVRFCWWGAEEVGLLGSTDHVKNAKTSTVVGERLQDYLINLNYDMLGSPNYIFGIYDGKTANNDTPTIALPGSNKITTLFSDWFVRQNLPWDPSNFDGRSDYGPFLAEGIVAGGLFSGADGIKTQEQRDRYDQILGQGLGGIAGASQDPCYHKACDSIQNINKFAYEKMVQAAAYALEYLGRQDELRAWLYPSTGI